MNIKDNLKLVVTDRSYLVSLTFMTLAMLAIVIIGIVHIRPSELQVPVHYSSFGITSFYRDKWYYLINFVAFGIIVATLHFLLSLKLYVAKGRQLAISFLWLTCVMLIISSVFAYAILRFVSLSQ